MPWPKGKKREYRSVGVDTNVERPTPVAKILYQKLVTQAAADGVTVRCALETAIKMYLVEKLEE